MGRPVCCTDLLCREEYLWHYHQRSNVESTFSAIKRKVGDSLRSKGDVSMVNEVLCKILAHNICCCIAECTRWGSSRTSTKAAWTTKGMRGKAFSP